MPKKELVKEIVKELLRDQQKIDNIVHGKVIICIQDGRVVRVEITEGRQIA